MTSTVVQRNDPIVLRFNDGRHVLTEAGPRLSFRFNRKTYKTANLVGLKYGTICQIEVGSNSLEPLPEGSRLDHDPNELLVETEVHGDNRNLEDTNNSQKITHNDINKWKDQLTKRQKLDSESSEAEVVQNNCQKEELPGCGKSIIQTLIFNSSTFNSKSHFSKAKYIKRKQQKYMLRCIILEANSLNLGTYYFESNPRVTLREDTVAQILSYANVYAGSQVLLFDETSTCIVLGSLAQRLGGFGRILSVFLSHQYMHIDNLNKFNLSHKEQQIITWLHSGEVFSSKLKEDTKGSVQNTTIDEEYRERESLKPWPCPLPDHTREYLEKLPTDKKRQDWLQKRQDRMIRKLTRPTTLEIRSMLRERLSDSCIIVTQFDPTETVLKMLPYLAPSCPFVVYSEHMGPLAECLHHLKSNNIALNLRLSDCWMREYQVLDKRSHPQMSMSQSGGYLLVGTKLCPVSGIAADLDIDETQLVAIKQKVFGKKKKKSKKRQHQQQAAESSSSSQEPVAQQGNCNKRKR